MYADDHPPPHVHVFGPGFSAQIDFESLEVMRGNLPRDVLEDSLMWIAGNRPYLRTKWRELNERDG